MVQIAHLRKRGEKLSAGCGGATMECIHLTHPRKFNIRENKWSRVAFRNNKGSLSIIGCDCVQNSRITLCEHIDKYYGDWSGITSDPPVFWQFNTEDLPPGYAVASAAGRDPCHFVVSGLDDQTLWEFFEPAAGGEALGQFSICANGNHRPLVLADVIAIKTK